jgi:hypothetical protein
MILSTVAAAFRLRLAEWHDVRYVLRELILSHAPLRTLMGCGYHF